MTEGRKVKCFSKEKNRNYIFTSANIQESKLKEKATLREMTREKKTNTQKFRKSFLNIIINNIKNNL